LALVLRFFARAWLYFVTFILAGTFIALNFFVGIIVNNLQFVTLEENSHLAEIRKSLMRLEARPH
jgi:voltage-gated sodium channel